MIEYKKAQKILLNSKIKIQNEIIFAKNSLHRVSAKNVFSPNLMMPKMKAVVIRAKAIGTPRKISVNKTGNIQVTMSIDRSIYYRFWNLEGKLDKLFL